MHVGVPWCSGLTVGTPPRLKSCERACWQQGFASFTCHPALGFRACWLTSLAASALRKRQQFRLKVLCWLGGLAHLAQELGLRLDALETSLLCGSIALFQLCSWEGVLYLRVAAPSAGVGGLRLLQTPLPPLSNFTSAAVTAGCWAVRARQFPLSICEVADVQLLATCRALCRGCSTFLKGGPVNALSSKLSQKKCCSLRTTSAMLNSSLALRMKKRIKFQRR